MVLLGTDTHTPVHPCRLLAGPDARDLAHSINQLSEAMALLLRSQERILDRLDGISDRLDRTTCLVLMMLMKHLASSGPRSCA